MKPDDGPRKTIRVLYTPPEIPKAHICDLPNRNTQGYKTNQVVQCSVCGKFWNSALQSVRAGPSFAWNEGCYHPKDRIVEIAKSGGLRNKPYSVCQICRETIS